MLHSEPRDSILSENKYKKASKGNFVLIERRGKDDLFATEVDPNVTSVGGSKMSEPQIVIRPSEMNSPSVDIGSLHESSDLPSVAAISESKANEDKVELNIPDLTDARTKEATCG